MKLKEILEIVKTQFKDLSTIDNPDFRLEQAEFKSDLNVWEVIVSFLVENTNKRSSPMAALTSEYQFHRMYKRVIIDENKEIVGFYIYNKE